MVARRHPSIEINRMEHRRSVQLDIAFLAQLARKRRKERLTMFDPAAGEMPARNVGMLDQEHAALAIENQGANAESEAARKSPVEVEKHADKRLQATTDSAQCHAGFRLRSGLASPIRIALK